MTKELCSNIGFMFRIPLLNNYTLFETRANKATGAKIPIIHS